MASVLESHPKRAEIDAALVGGMPLRKVVSTFGLQCSHMAVAHYRKNVLPEALATAHRILETEAVRDGKQPDSAELGKLTGQVSAAAPIISTLREDRDWTDRVLKGAESDADYKGFAANMRVKQGGLRMEAELTGALDTKPETHNTVNLVILGPEQLGATAESPKIESSGMVIDVAPQDVGDLPDDH